MDGSDRYAKLPRQPGSGSIMAAPVCWYSPPDPDQYQDTAKPQELAEQYLPPPSSTPSMKDVAPAINSQYPVHYIPVNWGDTFRNSGGQPVTSMGSQFQIGNEQTQKTRTPIPMPMPQVNSGQRYVRHEPVYNGFFPERPSDSAPPAPSRDPSQSCMQNDTMTSEAGVPMSSTPAAEVPVSDSVPTSSTSSCIDTLCGKCKACKFQSKQPGTSSSSTVRKTSGVHLVRERVSPKSSKTKTGADAKTKSTPPKK